MKAVIMAGGEGTRLRPLTCNIPKPMVPVVNRPMMEHILNLLKKHQITEIANTLWYMPEVIKNYFGDGSSRGVSMHYFVENQPLGTAGSVKNAKKFLDKPFIVVSGDSLTDINLSDAVKFHKSKKALATLVLTRVVNPLSYGVVITNEEGRITQFLEKPCWSEVFSDTVNTGIYILEPEVLTEIPDGKKYDFSQNLFPKLLQKNAPLYGYIAEGYWSDVGNLDVYRQAHQDCLDQKVSIELPSKKMSDVWVEEDSSIADDAVIEGPAYIGKGVSIASKCFIGKYSVIGKYSALAKGANIKRSVLWSGVQVGEDTQLRGCVLANNVRLDARVQAYEGCVIGEKTSVGLQSRIEPKVKIWPAKQITSGAYIVQSIIWGNQVEPSLFSAAGVRGDIRSFLTPEMITKFGLAYGGFMGRNKSIITSTDGSKIGRTAKRALITGLLASGTNVFDVGTVSGNLTRFGIAYIGAQGALHCQKANGQDNTLNIQCWDQRGYWLSKSDQRRIENMLWREDFPRPNEDQFGELAFVPGLIQQYIASVAKLYSSHLKGFRLRVKTNENHELALLIINFLEKAGCIICDDKPSITLDIEEKRWTVRDYQGTELTEDKWWEVFLHSQRMRNQQRVALPIHVSQNVADTALRHNMEIKWTKNDPRSWMEIASELGNTQLEAEKNVEHFPYIEPLVSIGEILSYLRKTNQPLSEICSKSKTIRVERSVFCPWEGKGKVMRRLINLADPAKTSFLDGLKYHKESGWTLVVPDGDEPVFHILSEANTYEEADALSDYYAQKIENIILGGD